MPKKSTPDADLKSEFAALKVIAKEEKPVSRVISPRCRPRSARPSTT